MFEIAGRLIAALDAGRTLAVATAVSIEGSAPRTVGTSMAFDGECVIGSIAGGCVEGAVVGVCEEVLADGQPRTVDYGISDENAFSVGLTCGGQLRIHVQLLTQTDATAAALRASIAGTNAAISQLTTSGDTFTEVAESPRHMIILGAMDFSSSLAAAGAALGYRVTVCDPRPLFATAERFPGVEVVVEWPTTWLARTPIDDRTVICVLSHDARYDAEALAIALATGAGYVGAMGSRTTHDRRVASLRERGVADADIARLHSPIGLDLGASTPAETAVSILAEVIAARTGAGGQPLRGTEGAIHRRSDERVTA